MERIMNEENARDHNVEGDSLEGSVVCVCREEMLLALNKMKTGNALGPSEVSLELISASGGVGIQVMAETFLKVLDLFGMTAAWSLCIAIPFFKWKRDIQNCSCY